MFDILQYPACKLYEKKRFRLPNPVRNFLQNKKIRKLVLIAEQDNKILLLPLSVWEKNIGFYKKNTPVHFPVRAQSLSSTFLYLHPELSNYLGETENLYFEESGDHYITWNEAGYQRENEKETEKLQRLYNLFDRKLPVSTDIRKDL